MRKLFCLLLCILLLTISGCAEEEEFIDEGFTKSTTAPTQPAETFSFGDAIGLMVKTFDNSFTQEDLYNMYPQQCWDWFEEQKGKTVEDVYNSFSARMTTNWQNTKAEVGEDAVVKFELVDRADLDEENSWRMKFQLEEKYGIDPNAVGICYSVTIKKATVGKLSEDIAQQIYHVFEMDNSWYVYEVLMNMPVI